MPQDPDAPDYTSSSMSALSSLTASPSASNADLMDYDEDLSLGSSSTEGEPMSLGSGIHLSVRSKAVATMPERAPFALALPPKRSSPSILVLRKRPREVLDSVHIPHNPKRMPSTGTRGSQELSPQQSDKDKRQDAKSPGNMEAVWGYTQVFCLVSLLILGPISLPSPVG